MKNRSGTVVPARATGNRDIVSSPNVLRWLAEGKIFEAGFGPEDAEENSSAALADIEGTFALVAPTGSTTLVMPLYLRLSCTADGGALSNWCVSFTRPALDCLTALTVAGTELTFKRNMNREYATSGNASALYGDAITVSVLTAADYVGTNLGNAIDTLLTGGLVNVGGPSNEVGYNFLGGNAGLPHILSKGAAMIVYIYTASTDSVWRGYMQWAELEAGDLY